MPKILTSSMEIVQKRYKDWGFKQNEGSKKRSQNDQFESRFGAALFRELVKKRLEMGLFVTLIHVSSFLCIFDFADTSLKLATTNFSTFRTLLLMILTRNPH